MSCGERMAITKLKTGLQKIISRMIAVQIRQQVSWAQSFGPQSSEPITNGLRLNFSRPLGGGRYGFAFGSVRPRPAGMEEAIVLGTMWIPMLSLPIFVLRMGVGE